MGNPGDIKVQSYFKLSEQKIVKKYYLIYLKNALP